MQELSCQSAPEFQWDELRPVLDQAMHQLNERERDAVLLRYFEGRQLADVGAKIGLSEDAARMRVARALEKLRRLLANQGVATTTAALGAALAGQTIIAAPAGLASTVAEAALASAAATGTTTLTLLKIMTMTKLKLGMISALIVAGVATPMLLQHQKHVKLREQSESLRQQNDQVTRQLAAAAAENLRLSNLVARAHDSPLTQSGASDELLRLRGEIARLRADARESAQTKSAAAESGNDPAIEAALKTWATRVTQLKQRLEQMPEKKIPELQFITDKDWFDAVKNAKQLESDADFRQALSDLRSNAKVYFDRMLQSALRGYGREHEGQLPTDLSQLKPYFQQPVDDAVLRRYSLLQTGKLEDVLKGAYLVGETAPPVDDEYDTVHRISITGINTSSVNRFEDAIKQAGLQFAQANKGLLPTEPSQLAPYLKEPIDPAAIQKVLNKVPPGVTTIEQLNALK